MQTEQVIDVQDIHELDEDRLVSFLVDRVADSRGWQTFWGRDGLIWLHDYNVERRRRKASRIASPQGDRDHGLSLHWCKEMLRKVHEFEEGVLVVVRGLGDDLDKDTVMSRMVDQLLGVSLSQLDGRRGRESSEEEEEERLVRHQAITWRMGSFRRAISGAKYLLNIFAGSRLTRRVKKRKLTQSFSKMVELWFDRNKVCVGGSMDLTYLDLTHMWDFDIFYQIVGADRIANYGVLSEELCPRPSEVDKGFEETQTALKLFGFSSEERKQLFSLVRLVLELGCCESGDDADPQRKVTVSNLIGLTVQQLDEFDMKHLCNVVYTGLMHWLVKRINENIETEYCDAQTPIGKVKFMGLIDPTVDQGSKGHAMLLKNWGYEVCHDLCNKVIQHAEEKSQCAFRPRSSQKTPWQSSLGVLDRIIHEQQDDDNEATQKEQEQQQQQPRAMILSHSFGMAQYDHAQQSTLNEIRKNRDVVHSILDSSTNMFLTSLLKSIADRCSFVDHVVRDVDNMRRLVLSQSVWLKVVYCIKFESDDLFREAQRSQLEQLGLMERAQERSARYYPIRIPLSNFWEDFSFLRDEHEANVDVRARLTKKLEQVIPESDRKQKNLRFHVGKNFVFLMKATYDYLRYEIEPEHHQESHLSQKKEYLISFVHNFRSKRLEKKRNHAASQITLFLRAILKRRDMKRALRVKRRWETFAYTKLHYEEACVTIQSYIRRYFMMKRMRGIRARREPWKAFLRPNEAIVITSRVVKTVDVLRLKKRSSSTSLKSTDTWSPQNSGDEGAEESSSSELKRNSNGGLDSSLVAEFQNHDIPPPPPYPPPPSSPTISALLSQLHNDDGGSKPIGGHLSLGPTLIRHGSSSSIQASPRRKSRSLMQSRKVRQLIYTTGPYPRLFYVSVDNDQRFKGDITWESGETSAVATSNCDFVIHSLPDPFKKKSEWRFSIVPGDNAASAHDWVNALRVSYSVHDLFRYPRGVFEYLCLEPILMEGILLKRQHGLYRERWFTLRSSTLEWRRKKSDVESSGGCEINCNSGVYASNDKFSFELINSVPSAAARASLKLKAKTKADYDIWTRQLNKVVSDQSMKSIAIPPPPPSPLSKFNSVSTMESFDEEDEEGH